MRNGEQEFENLECESMVKLVRKDVTQTSIDS